MTTIHHSPPPGATPFAIYEDPEDQEPPSPSEIYEGEVSFTSFTSDMSGSGADIAIPSIEGEHDLQEDPEPYSGSYTSRRPSILSSSRRDSTMTANSFVSSLPSEMSVASKPVPPADALESRYSPRKERPPFRNPSSVRAMQMASPPPLLAPERSRERTKGSYKLATPSRSGRSDSVSTTGTRRSRSHRESQHREYQSPRPAVTPQPLPLVLLHVTILPMQMPYTSDVMVKIMPEWLVENYKVLEEKLQDIVLMRRGLLIQHPRDEYDLLEERILESLELKTPRLLKCGHFVAPDSDDEDIHEGYEEHNTMADDRTSVSGGTVTAEDEPGFRYPTPNSDDASMCLDCHRHIKKPGHGVGAGSKRWDIKIYAANGLMRAGAWTAAWSEMERCDVEISPWIPHDVRKSLEKRLEQEHEAARVKALYAAELQRQMEEEAAVLKNLEEEAEVKRRMAAAELQHKIEAEADALAKKLEQEAAEKRHLEETLNLKIEEAKEAMRLEFEAQALAEANCTAGRLRAMEDALKSEREKAAMQAPPVSSRTRSRSRSRARHQSRSRSRRPRVEEIPLGTLLKNYFVLQLQDSRNFFILILGALVVFLLTNSSPNWHLGESTLNLVPGHALNDVVQPTMPVIVTSTLVVTEVRTLESAQATLLPAPSDVPDQQFSNHNLETPSPLSSEDASAMQEVQSSTSEATQEEPSAMTVSTDESQVGADDENAKFTNTVSQEIAEASVIEDASPAVTDEPASVEVLSESEALPEPVTSTVEAVKSEEPSPSAAPVSPALTNSVFFAEVSPATELIEPLEPASTASDPTEEVHVESEAHINHLQNSEEPQVDTPMMPSDETASVEHARDEL